MLKHSICFLVLYTLLKLSNCTFMRVGRLHMFVEFYEFAGLAPFLSLFSKNTEKILKSSYLRRFLSQNFTELTYILLYSTIGGPHATCKLSLVKINPPYSSPPPPPLRRKWLGLKTSFSLVQT